MYHQLQQMIHCRSAEHRIALERLGLYHLISTCFLYWTIGLRLRISWSRRIIAILRRWIAIGSFITRYLWTVARRDHVLRDCSMPPDAQQSYWPTVCFWSITGAGEQNDDSGLHGKPDRTHWRWSTIDLRLPFSLREAFTASIEMAQDHIITIFSMTLRPEHLFRAHEFSLLLSDILTLSHACPVPALASNWQYFSDILVNVCFQIHSTFSKTPCYPQPATRRPVR